MINLKGCYTALVTPMIEQDDADCSIDYDGFRRNVQLQISAGIAGLCPASTTGESPTLEDDEWEKLTAICVKEAANAKSQGKSISVVAATGSNNTAHTLEKTKRAKALGADAALIVIPYYNKPTDSGIVRHFEEAAKAELPLIIYDVPARTSRPLSAALISQLAQMPQVIGIKEASGDIALVEDVIAVSLALKKKDKDFAVLSGDDALSLPLIALGGCGLISVVSNLVPAQMAGLVSACLEGRNDEARAAYYYLLPLFKAAFIETNPIAIKRAMTLAGLPAGPTRLPLSPLSDENEKIIREELTRFRI
jgi:4-hydroxy-tetrahydrodipicolinate synthase